MQEKLLNLKNEALAQIMAVRDNNELEKIRVEYLGKNSGKLTLVIKKIPELEPDQKVIVGRFANEVKKMIEDALERQKALLQKEREENIAEAEWIDVTIPGIRPPEGHLHPLTQTLADVISLSRRLGFQIAAGPEIETDNYNFEKVNMPPDSPSRDTQASFYLDPRGSKVQPGEILLRTHTSNMQSRVMEKSKPPLRVLVPGKCYRVDDVDASHNIEFYQFEGFVVDRGISLTDLLGTVDYFLKELIPGTEVKFYATHFDFTEPSVEAYIRCTICGGKGCAYCKNQGWSEVLGSGMIHPHVLKFAGMDPHIYTGFAFGMGLTRLAILRYQLDDIRLLHSLDMRVLEQF